MRTRTDSRRQAILAQAAAVFHEVGYERASMAQIAERVGGSKTTLYGYFTSKQELFIAVMNEAAQAQGDALTAMIDADATDLGAALTRFGRAYLAFLLSPEVVAAKRIGIGDGGAVGVGPTLFAQGPGRGHEQLTRHLQKWIDRGRLRRAPARIAALHLIGLLEAGLVDSTLHGAKPLVEVGTAVPAAIDAFLRAYGTADMSA